MAPFLYHGDRPKGRTTLYTYYRVCERFPCWFKTEQEVADLAIKDPERYARLLAYEKIREGEEAESL